MKIFYVPIEPYDRRYTRDWIEQFKREFESANITHKIVLGEWLGGSLDPDTVLDACGTNYYKMSQLMRLIEFIKSKELVDGDVIFFADLWFPGLEALFYIRNMMGVRFKICGIFHAGTWDKEDFTCRYGMRTWGNHLESSWLMEVDEVYVATLFHRNLIVNDLLNKGIKSTSDFSNIKVTGIPFYAQELIDKYGNKPKKNIVVFPHRIAPEKRPELFDEVEKAFRCYFPESGPVRFVKTIEVTKNSKEYFELLAESKIVISFALQETFGYSMLEAIALGCHPIAPYGLSYKETICNDYLVVGEIDPIEIASRIAYILKGDHIIHPRKIINFDKWENSIARMIKLMKEL